MTIPFILKRRVRQDGCGYQFEISGNMRVPGNSSRKSSFSLFFSLARPTFPPKRTYSWEHLLPHRALRSLGIGEKEIIYSSIQIVNFLQGPQQRHHFKLWQVSHIRLLGVFCFQRIDCMHICIEDSILFSSFIPSWRVRKKLSFKFATSH